MATRGLDSSGRTRDPEGTRERLLQCAFEEVHEKGYTGASLDQILADSGVTKGALYHHFGSKADLGVAMIDEVIHPIMMEMWVEPMLDTEDPLGALIARLQAPAKHIDDRWMNCGCPLNNLAQELSNADERFRAHIHRVFEAWRGNVAEALERGQAAGTVRCDVDPSSVAAFIVVGIEGLATTLKSSRDLELAAGAAGVFIQFLEGLRPD